MMFMDNSSIWHLLTLSAVICVLLDYTGLLMHNKTATPFFTYTFVVEPLVLQGLCDIKKIETRIIYAHLEH